MAIVRIMVSLVAAFENPFKRNRASRNWPEIRLHSLLIRENEFKKIEKNSNQLQQQRRRHNGVRYICE